MSKPNFKTSLFNQLLLVLDKQTEETKAELASIIDARNSDTKSSAGDKFETGRAMMQMESEKQEARLEKLLQMKNDLSKIDIHKVAKEIGLGSLVITNHENYFITIAFGKISNDNITAYAISSVSPMGSALFGKKVNDEVSVNGRVIQVIDLL